MYSDYPWSILSDHISLYHAFKISKTNIIICRAIAHGASVLYKTTELQPEVGLQAEVLYKTTSAVQNEPEANK